MTQALLPALILAIHRSGLVGPAKPSGSSSSAAHATSPTSTALLTTTIAAVAFLGGSFQPADTALGLCIVFLTAQAFSILDINLRVSQDDKHEQRGAYIAANGSILRRGSLSLPPNDNNGNVILACVRDFSAAYGISLAALVAVAEVFGPRRSSQTMPLQHIMPATLSQWMLPTCIDAVQIISIVAAVSSFFHRPCNIHSLDPQLSRCGAYNSSIIFLTATMTANLCLRISLPGLWFTLITLLVASCAYDDSSLPVIGFPSIRSSRMKHIASLLAAAAVVIVWLSNAGDSPTVLPELDIDIDVAPLLPPRQTFEPLQLPDAKTHPISYFVADAVAQFDAVRKRQSKTLAEAVQEYKRRYDIPPPPHFDKWYDFAARGDVQLIDEHDAIHNSMLPFWAFEPAELRSRVQQALGYELNAFIALVIRGGAVVKVEGGTPWQRNATIGMIKSFVQYLPDMDVAFNIHDEPRVVVPHDELARMVERAKQRFVQMRGNTTPRNAFSRAKDLGNGRRLAEAKETRFNEYPHQLVWVPSALSCPLDSPARDSFGEMGDNLTSYAAGELGFIYNETAFADICMSPSLRASYGFFNRPNAFKLSHELVPVFSQSKISSYQDILYPSPWYWSGNIPSEGEADWFLPAVVTHDEAREVAWQKKQDVLWWRGSTTGGFSRDGGWRRQHRQNIVKKLNALGPSQVLSKTGGAAWQVGSVSRAEVEELLDVHFSGVGQCDAGDCEAMLDFFKMAGGVDMQEAWRYKYLLDMDGNAFSGRFYAFLESTSLVFKMAIFREWHAEWLRAWVHYVPLSLRGGEHVEAVRYFAREDEGRALGPKLAQQGRAWARKVLRPVDMEAYLFRLLLEYGRVVDDDRERIGFVG